MGHRPDRLGTADVDALAGVLRTILRAVVEEVQRTARAVDARELYADAAPILRAISPLAEGTDRLFAEQALDLGFELCCVMPFPQAEFEHDFAAGKQLEPDSLARFRSLLERAGSTGRLATFELDGNRRHPGSAYAAAGRVVRNQSDLLVVVWDGERLDKRGGTEETFDEARRRAVPVVWIDARAPHRWQLVDAARPLPRDTTSSLLSPERSDTVDDLRRTVQDALDLPTTSGGQVAERYGSRQRLLDFYAERKPVWNATLPWKLFMDAVGDSRWPRVSLTVQDFEQAETTHWPTDKTSALGALVARLRPYYAWPDQLAVIYGDWYRSAFITAFVLAAVAVGMALLPWGAQMAPHSLPEMVCIAIELLAILVIMFLVLRGRQRRWHERWLDYRLMAELVRHLRTVAPLGAERPFPQVPAHLATYGQPAATWMAWYVRAIERAVGLPSVIVDRGHLQACLAHLRETVDEQLRYHEANAVRCLRIEGRLHFGGIVLLAVTLIACVLHLLLGIWHANALAAWLPASVLSFLSGFLPALGAAMAGVSNQGEFRRIAKRSAAMCDRLRPLRDRIDAYRIILAQEAAPHDRQDSVDVAARMWEAATLLVSEVLDWRVVFLDRPLDPPA